MASSPNLPHGSVFAGDFLFRGGPRSPGGHAQCIGRRYNGYKAVQRLNGRRSDGNVGRLAGLE